MAGCAETAQTLTSNIQASFIARHYRRMNRRGYPVPLARRYYAVRYARLGGQNCDPFWIEPDVLHAVGCISGRHANGASWMGTPAVITSCSPAKTFVPPPGRMGARAPS